jgi:predicted GNAT family acetyltransferase
MQVTHDSDTHRFFIATDHGDAVLEYTADEEHVVFTHTFVPPQLRGQGIAEALVRAGLAWAAETRRVVTATCSYVARYLERNPQGQNASTD